MLGLAIWGAYKLDAQLSELAGFPSQRLLLSHHRRLIAQTQRKSRGITQAARHHACNGKCEVRPEHEQAVVVVDQLKGHAFYAPRSLQHFPRLQKRRLNRQISGSREDLAYAAGDLFASQCLLRKYVAEPSGGAVNHRDSFSQTSKNSWIESMLYYSKVSASTLSQ